MSLIDGNLQFCPGILYKDLDWDVPSKITSAFGERILQSYIYPAEESLNENRWFTTGILCVCAIDCLTRLETPKETVGKSDGRVNIKDTTPEEYVDWMTNVLKVGKSKDPQRRYVKCRTIMPEWKKETLAFRFYKELRCGLVHEGYVKEGGYFARGSEFPILDVIDNTLVVNPELLLEQLRAHVKYYYIERPEAVARDSHFMRNVTILFSKEREMLR
jgi:hypothetical protein